MEQWRKHFESVPDPRKAGHAFTYRLCDVLMLALCAMLCGAETFVEMEEFGWAKQEWLCQRLGLGFEEEVPSHDTIGRLFWRLNPQAFGACFEAWTQELHEQTQGQILAVDGKSVRRSFDTATGKKALHVVSVWAHEGGHMKRAWCWRSRKSTRRVTKLQLWKLCCNAWTCVAV